MRKFFVSCSTAILSLVLFLPGQENPTESSNLYDRMGVIAERGLHGAVPEEHVDLFSGSLVLKYLDITLPGPNGFDLNVWRVYNSKVNTERTDTTYSYPQQETASWVGYGWSMHMGRLLNPDSTNPAIEFPDGRQEGTYPWIHDSGVLITRNFLQLKKYDAAHGGLHTLYFQDGTVWIFGASSILWLKGAQVPIRMVTEIENSYGHKIIIEYYPSTSKLKKITDALGRVVLFNLDGDGNLDSITAPHLDGTATYDYTVTAQAWGDSAYTRLDAMKPPVLNAVSYGYNDSTHKELNQVTTSYGGTISYTFEDQDFKYFDDTMHTRALAGKTIQFSAGNSSTWEYEYGDYSGNFWITIYVDGETETQVNAGFTKVTGPVNVEHVWFFGPDNDVDEAWRAGLMAFKQTFDGTETDLVAYSQQAAEAEQISTDLVWVRGRSWGTAKGVLQTGGYQAKVGDCGQYVAYDYDDSQLRKFGLPSNMYVAGPYQVDGQSSKLPQGWRGKTIAENAGADSFSRARFAFYKGSKDVFDLDGKTSKHKALSLEMPTHYYLRYGKTFFYAFTDTSTYPDFQNRYMLNLVTTDSEFDPEYNTLKATFTEYFTNGAIKQTSRWQGGTTLLDWD